MVKIHRGEIEAKIDGKKLVLCLTLGALAELESSLDASDLVSLGERFATGKISARHLIIVLGAGLRGAGNDISNEELANLPIEGGLTGAASIAARLLHATFGELSE
ncbi:MAG: gene transfer agent family protein [Devosiaceae bacterium]|nr:gene transfer agent family protein [Devosiaceae bacterium]